MDDKRMQKLLEAIINIIFNVIYLPIHVLEKTIEWIQDNWRKGVEWIRKGILNLWKKWISKLFAPKEIYKKFVIFDEVWRSLTQMNCNLARDYQEEHVFMLVAFLLEVVSFFSTYEGNALYFSGLFYEAPLIIALVIQLGLLVSANTTFRHGKKRYATRLIMVLLLIISILFSYTGLYIGNRSPKAEYDEAKKDYIDAYETALEELKAREPEDEELYANAVYIISTAEMEVRNAEGVIKVLDERIDKTGEPEKNIVSVIRETTENGEPKSTTVTSADPEYINLSNMLDTATNERNDLQQFCVDATEVLKKYGAVEDGNTEAEYLELKFYFPLEQEGRTNAELYELKNDLQKLIECNNNLCKVLNVGTKLSDEWLDDYVDILEWRKRLEDLELEEQGMTEEKEQEKQEHYIDKILNYLNISLETSSMSELSRQKQEIQSLVNESYNRIIATEGLQEKTEERLTEAKEKVSQLSDPLEYALDGFCKKTTCTTAWICLFLALFNDGLAVLFSYASTRKAESFLYIRTSKDYYTDMDEFFQMLFRSMQSNYIIKIRKNQFENMSDAEFRNECMLQIQNTIDYIRQFLNALELSPCTVDDGFDMCCICRNQKEQAKSMKEYEAIMSTLAKTNLGKIISRRDYEDLELKFYRDWEFKGDEKKIYSSQDRDEVLTQMRKEKERGYVFLLKNRAENYLRGFLSERIVVTEDQDTKKEEEE